MRNFKQNLGPVGPEREGNISLSPSKKQGKQAFGWVFTLNNYSDEDIRSIRSKFENMHMCKYLFAKEVGEQGTPHLQGFVLFAKKTRWSALKLTKSIRWDTQRGTIKEAMIYCAKTETPREDIYTNVRIPRGLKKLKCEGHMFPWQQELLDIAMAEPDDRTIHWIWEAEGNTGKTTFMRYLMRFQMAIPLEGKKNDILMIAQQNDSDIYIYDIERSLENFVSYGSIEKIKNGCYMSGKYEGGIVDRNPPHLFIFANFSPEVEKLSADRWFIRKIVDRQLVLEQ